MTRLAPVAYSTPTFDIPITTISIIEDIELDWRGVMSSLHNCHEINIDVLESLYEYYEITDPDTIRNLIEDAKDLASILENAPIFIGEHYNDNNLKLKLGTLEDPEAGISNTITITLLTSLAPSDAFAQWQSFLKTYGLSIIDKSHNRIAINIEPL